MISWQFMLVGTFAAVGAAMSLGTLAALLRYRRTGEFPGAEPGELIEPTRGQMIGLWVRIVLGAAIAVAGFVSLDASNLI